MTKINLNWSYAKGELDTDTLKLICIPARGKRKFGADEMDAGLCIKDTMNFTIAEIHLGDVESSNILCEEIVKRFNSYKGWKKVEEELPEVDMPVLVATRNGKYSVSSMYIPTDCHGEALGEKRWRGSSSFADSIICWKEIDPVELKEDLQ